MNEKVARLIDLVAFDMEPVRTLSINEVADGLEGLTGIDREKIKDLFFEFVGV